MVIQSFITYNFFSLGDYKVDICNKRGEYAQMTQQKSKINSNESLDNNKDTSTYTAYGDPIKDSSPSSNNMYAKATSPIAESTQNDSNIRLNIKSKKKDTTAYGDPVKNTQDANPNLNV